MSSIATSALQAINFPEASRSIASNAENAVRMTNARQNFANTATSARGKKRTHGLVFKGNHKNDKGRYKRYYRSSQFAEGFEHGDDSIEEQNPMTREWDYLKLARISDKRKVEFIAAIRAKNPGQITRIIGAGYKPPRAYACDVIEAVACKNGGLLAIETMFKTNVRPLYQELEDAWSTIMKCSDPKRGQELLRLFLRYKLEFPDYGETLEDILDYGVTHGFHKTTLTRVVTASEFLRRVVINIVAKVMLLQAKRHPKGETRPALKELFKSLSISGEEEKKIFTHIVQYSSTPARAVRWLIEDIVVEPTVDYIETALEYAHVPIAVYILKHKTRRGYTSEFTKASIMEFFKKNGTYFAKDPRKAKIERIFRKILSIPNAPRVKQTLSWSRQNPRFLTENINVENGDVITTGRMNKTKGMKTFDVTSPGHSISVKLLRNRDKPSLPPWRLASHADWRRFQRNQGIIRQARRPNGTVQDPMLPPPNNNNITNQRYVKANAAARKIQAAWKRSR